MSDLDRDEARREAVLDQLRALHQEVEGAVVQLADWHLDRLLCEQGCAECCVDEIAVFEVEAELIRRAASELLESGRPAPGGECAFLDEHGSCRIYNDRPYVCRTQGLPLRLVEKTDAGEVEHREICPLNETEEPIEELQAEECWTIGPFEERLADLQLRFGGALDRVPLRSLFRRKPRRRSRAEPPPEEPPRRFSV